MRRVANEHGIRWAGAAVVAMALMAAIAPPIAAEEQAPGFEYLYIVANEGGSSGGHTAIRFGHNVFHFQNQDGLLVLHRERQQDFLHEYALLGNRTVHSTRVEASSETVATIQAAFRARHRAQEAQLEIAESLRRDRLLLERLRDRERASSRARDPVELPLRGLGYFMPRSSEQRDRSPTVASFRAEIEARYGTGSLSRRRHEVGEALRALLEEDPTDWPVALPRSADEHPLFARSFSSRWEDALGGLAALDVLEHAWALDPAAYHSPGEDAFVLEPRVRRALADYAKRHRQQLVELVVSRRSDWGQTFLVGLARLVALEQSIESGRLVFLDSFPEASGDVARVAVDPGRGIAPILLEENRQQLARSLSHFRDAIEPDELAWERVEERSNRYSEMLRALAGDDLLRVAQGHLVPSRSAPYASPFGPTQSAAVLSERVALARHRERSHARALKRLHRYGLITQNCATALFETLNASLGGTPEASEAKLGGFIGSRYSLSFIPFVSDRQVADRYRVSERRTIWSYRQMRMRAMRDEENRLAVALRESNVWTAQTYEGSDSDSFFVFFTEEPVLLRPILGTVNLVAAVGESALGLLTAPIDEGAMLMRGLRGAFVSLPELVFANIRKGSNDWIPPEHRGLEID